MAKFAPLIFLLLFTGCSAGITTHDNFRAAELIVDFLSSLKSEQGIPTAYDWTDDSYKENVSLSEFTRIVSSIRSKNSKADIHLVGFETFGSREMIVVYANSETDSGKLFFKFSLTGTKTRDYYLLDFSTNDSGFVKKGIYREFEESIVVRGV